MSETLYPWGYGKSLVTASRLWELSRMNDLCDPATARRFKAYILSKGGKLGIGSSVRFVQPEKAGFAPPGKSFHEMQQWSDGKKNFAALDLVMRNGGNVHRSPYWSEVPKQGSGHADISNYGVHANVSGEPWHLQPIEVDGWETWANNGRRRPNPNFAIKGGAPPPSTPTQPPPTTGKTYGPGERVLRVTSPMMEGMDVAYVQLTLKTKAGQDITVDGKYGDETAGAVKNLQRLYKFTVDGVVGMKETWPAIIQLNKIPAATHTYPVGSRTLRLTSPTMKGDDVKWVQNVLLEQKLNVSTDGIYGRQTRDKVKIVQGWNDILQDGVVGPKTFEVLKKY